MDNYKLTGLWRRAFGASNAQTSDALILLESAYGVFRERASALTAHIAKTLPNLTMHDVTHLDALWETADLIAGEGYPLNPAEAFVFGGAVLLHDAALCFEAYEGGQKSLRETLEWKDAFAAVDAKNPTWQTSRKTDEADFAAMRLLHASQAAELAHLQWSTPEGEPLYLIENHELRKHYGRIIGNIAASHHWPIEDVVSKLPGQINALAKMPRDWRVDPVKIACLLRCADAAHLDSRRAPDFLRALASLHGVSAQHWTAQNWLERADGDAADPEQNSIIFTSGKSFDEANADAWWVAYDAINLVHRELTSSAELLERRAQSIASPPFQMRRVTGANSPLAASKTITTTGWSPQSVEIHVGNLERLISQLGGDKLYGDDQSFVIVLRELIQNARDSVVARRAIDKQHVGKIVVKLETSVEGYSISVEDDGVGMSHRVMTGSLLDFGTSFWASDLVRNEFPGLLSEGYKPVGKFGIGFYSVFMIAAAVSVSSRRFDTGRDSVVQIRFPKGLSLRPLVASGAPQDFGYSTSTIVKLLLQSEYGDPSTVLISRGRVGYDPEMRVSLVHCLSFLCAGLDVAVDLVSYGGSTLSVHRPLSDLDTLEKRLSWLFAIAGTSEQDDQGGILREHAERLRPIKVGDQVIGMAALSTAGPSGQNNYGSVSTVGGLAQMMSKSGITRFAGSIDYLAHSAKREASSYATGGKSVLEAWADEQKKLLPPRENDLLAWCFATHSLSDLQCDPIDVATVMVRDGDNYWLVTLDQLLDIISTRGVAFYQSSIMDHLETNHNLGSFNEMPTFWPIKNSAFISLNRGDDGEIVKTSFLSCIYRRAAQLGREIEAEYSDERPASYFGVVRVLILKGKKSPPNITVKFDL